MARGLITEAKVTREVIKILKRDNWSIISFDLPQMGTGTLLKKDGQDGKNKNTIIPDIFAYKNGKVILCECKSFFSKEDINKLMKLRTGSYNTSIEKKLNNLKWHTLLLSVGYPLSKYNKAEQCFKNLDLVFLIGKKNHKIIEPKNSSELKNFFNS